ncbi:MAG TPA: alpha/beta fold hydrolase [Methylomirabilota bacterium]|jgi:pimeloyl-ACP methyl ester carboxylesterase|nr:alpha/beta fold hydrolase [Methylomirabilota bacterium]
MTRIRLKHGALDGLELHCTSEGQGPATLLIHGLGGFAGSWRYTTAALVPHARVIAFDLPGFGQSAKPRGRYTLEFFVQALDALLRVLEVERVRLVGHSLGGAIATAFALAYPERVERLALVSPIVPGFPLRPSSVYRLMMLPAVGELLSRFVTPRICVAALERCLFAPDPAEIAFLVEHEYAARATREGRAAYLATLRGIRQDFTTGAAAYRTALGEWDRPTLIIHGRQDRVVPLRHAQTAAQGIRRAQARWLDRCGHFPQIEHAEAVNGWLGEFLLASAGR